MEDNLIKRLMTSIKCGVCGRHYEESRINILGHQREMWFLSASCAACGTRCLVAVAVKKDGLPEVVTDLTEAEMSRFWDVAAPIADEVLDMHSFLKDFDGDFGHLFGQEEPDKPGEPPTIP